MQITLNEAEILEAIEEKVRKQINIEDNQDISIALRAGRGPDGFTAALDITERVTSAKKKPVQRAVAAKVEEPTETTKTVGAGCDLPDRPEPSPSLFDTVDSGEDEVESEVVPSDAAISLNPENRQEDSATSIFG